MEKRQFKNGKVKSLQYELHLLQSLFFVIKKFKKFELFLERLIFLY